MQKEQLAHLEEQQLDLTDFYLLRDARGAPVYDVLLFAGSDGAVFATGTSKVVAVVAQGGADAEDGALCVAIDAAFEALRLKPPRRPATKGGRRRRRGRARGVALTASAAPTPATPLPLPRWREPAR